MMLEIETIATVDATIACACWLVRRDQEQLAIDMREEFLTEWSMHFATWNERCGAILDYIARKGETPGISTEHVRAVYVDVIEGEVIDTN